MKKLGLLVILLVAFLVIPFTVKADDEEVTSNESNEVSLYFFRGQGCSHCAEAEEWFASIEEEYGSKFKLVDYEVWYNEENSKLMDRVANARGEDVQGVPYIIVGNASWNGFTDSYKSEILAKIDSEYEKTAEDRYDIMNYLGKEPKEKDTTGQDIFALIVILLITGGVGFGIYKARTITK